MLHVEVAAALEYVQKANPVAVHVGVGVLYRVAHACLCRQMYYLVKLNLVEQHVEGALVLDVEAQKRVVGPFGAHRAVAHAQAGVGLYPCPAQAVELQLGRVVVVDVVDSHHLVASFGQHFGAAAANESGRAGYEYLHLLLIFICSGALLLAPLSFSCCPSSRDNQLSFLPLRSSRSRVWCAVLPRHTSFSAPRSGKVP